MLPHPTLTNRYANTEGKPEFVNQLFDKGAKHYDGIVDWGFLRSGAGYRRWVQQRLGLKKADHLLDVACGTGLVAVESAKILGTADNIACLDPSEGMLGVARKKLSTRFAQARAEAMPLADNSFDFLTTGYALRHVTDLEVAFREYARVLKPAGPIAGFLFRIYFGRIYPFLGGLFTRSGDAKKMMLYYWETMDACVPPALVLEALRNAGLTEVKRNSVIGLFSEYTAVKA